MLNKVPADLAKKIKCHWLLINIFTRQQIREAIKQNKTKTPVWEHLGDEEKTELVKQQSTALFV